MLPFGESSDRGQARCDVREYRRDQSMRPAEPESRRRRKLRLDSETLSTATAPATHDTRLQSNTAVGGAAVRCMGTVGKVQAAPSSGQNFFSNNFPVTAKTRTSGARFTKYRTTILRLSYDNAKVTIDLRRTSNLQNIPRRAQGFS